MNLIKIIKINAALFISVILVLCTLTYSYAERLKYDLVFLIDQSGSMSVPVDGAPPADPNNLRVEAVKLFAELCSDNDRFSIVGFGDNSMLLCPLISPTKDFNKICSALDSIVSRQGNTDILAGLKTAYDILSVTKNENRIPVVVLLTDGKVRMQDLKHIIKGSSEEKDKKYNSYKTELFYTVDKFKEMKCRIMCIGLGPNFDGELLTRAAKQTDGLVYPAEDATKLLEIYQKIYFDMRCFLKNIKHFDSEKSFEYKSSIENSIFFVETNKKLNSNNSMKLTASNSNGSQIEPSKFDYYENTKAKSYSIFKFHKLSPEMKFNIIKSTVSPSDPLQFTIIKDLFLEVNRLTPRTGEKIYQNEERDAMVEVYSTSINADILSKNIAVKGLVWKEKDRQVISQFDLSDVEEKNNKLYYSGQIPPIIEPGTYVLTFKYYDLSNPEFLNEKSGYLIVAQREGIDISLKNPKTRELISGFPATFEVEVYGKNPLEKIDYSKIITKVQVIDANGSSAEAQLKYNADTNSFCNELSGILKNEGTYEIIANSNYKNFMTQIPYYFTVYGKPVFKITTANDEDCINLIDTDAVTFKASLIQNISPDLNIPDKIIVTSQKSDVKEEAKLEFAIKDTKEVENGKYICVNYELKILINQGFNGTIKFISVDNINARFTPRSFNITGSLGIEPSISSKISNTPILIDLFSKFNFKKDIDKSVNAFLVKEDDAGNEIKILPVNRKINRTSTGRYRHRYFFDFRKNKNERVKLDENNRLINCNAGNYKLYVTQDVSEEKTNIVINGMPFKLYQIKILSDEDYYFEKKYSQNEYFNVDDKKFDAQINLNEIENDNGIIKFSIGSIKPEKSSIKVNITGLGIFVKNEEKTYKNLDKIISKKVTLKDGNLIIELKSDQEKIKDDFKHFCDLEINYRDLSINSADIQEQKINLRLTFVKPVSYKSLLYAMLIIALVLIAIIIKSKIKKVNKEMVANEEKK